MRKFTQTHIHTCMYDCLFAYAASIAGGQIVYRVLLYMKFISNYVRVVAFTNYDRFVYGRTVVCMLAYAPHIIDNGVSENGIGNGNGHQTRAITRLVQVRKVLAINQRAYAHTRWLQTYTHAQICMRTLTSTYININITYASVCVHIRQPLGHLHASAINVAHTSWWTCTANLYFPLSYGKQC